MAYLLPASFTNAYYSVYHSMRALFPTMGRRVPRSHTTSLNLIGYTLYAFINATLGATVSRQEDLGSMAVIPGFLVLPGCFIAVRAIESPDLVIGRLVSIFPPWTR